jgi:uncharacterized protein with HEPN domain
MPHKSPDKYLLDMVLASQKIQRFLDGYDKKRFETDDRTISAVQRQLEIIAAAAKQIDETTRARFPEIDFSIIVEMQKIIVRDYVNIGLETMWSVVQKQVPRMIQVMSPYLERLRKNEPERKPPGSKC